jgi:hypothetical protein
MSQFADHRLEFVRGHPILFQDSGGGFGNTERFALRESHRPRLSIEHKT